MFNVGAIPVLFISEITKRASSVAFVGSSGSRESGLVQVKCMMPLMYRPTEKAKPLCVMY